MIDRVQAGWWRAQPATDGARRALRAVKVETSDPRSSVAFWALMSYTVVMFLSPQYHIPALQGLRLAFLTGGVAVAAHLADVLRRRSAGLVPEVRAAAALVAWAVVTALLTYRPGSSGPFFYGLPFVLGLLVKSAVVFWLLSEVMTTVARLRRVAWVLTLMTVPMAAVAIRNFLVGNVIAGRVVGYMGGMNTGDPNGLAYVLCFILPFGLALLTTARSPLVRGAMFLIIALNMVAVVVTFSRTGFVTLGAVILLYLVRLLRRQRAWGVAMLVLVLACIPFLPSGYLSRLATMTDINSDPTGSAQARWADTRLAVGLALTNPIFGVGIGQNVLALNEIRGPTWMVVHNVYLMYAVDLGAPGLILFMLLLVQCVNSAGLVRRRSAEAPALRDLSCLAEAIQTSLVIFAISAFLIPNAYELHFYYFGGLAVAARAAYATAVRVERAAAA